jgi:hypothetical protein
MNKRINEMDLNSTPYFLVSQEDLYKIDSLIGALNLAITEILEKHPIRNDPDQSTSAQDDLDRQLEMIFYKE